jgi:glycosyltransferase involved in cell wall biosynthesis
LLVTDSLDVGGAERYVVDLAVALRGKGYEVAVACSVAGALSDPLDRSKIPVRPLLRRLVKRRTSMAFAWKLRRLLKAERFDLVHAHVYASAAAAAIATSGTGVPLVITEHTEGPWRTRRAPFQPVGLPARGARDRRLERDPAAPDRRIRRAARPRHLRF